MSNAATNIGPVVAAAAFVIALALGVAIILAIRPLLERIALAKPNARSSHTVPTPQGGGIAVIAATISSPLASFICPHQPFWRPRRCWLSLPP